MTNRVVRIPLIVLAAILALTTVACGRDEPQPPASQASVPDVPVGTDIGQRAPDFTLKDLEGNAISLSDFRGRPVLLNIMHTWCVPCNASAPDMAAAFEANKDKGLVILAVDVEEPAEAVEAFIAKYGLTYPFVLDPNGEVVRQYRVRGVPTSYFLDANGVIRAIQPGELTREWIENNLAAVSS